MKKLFFGGLIIASCYGLSHASIICAPIGVQIDSSQNYQLDIDGDNVKDLWFYTALSPYVNNYVVGLNGTQIEVDANSGTNADRARRIEAGNHAVGDWYWNDTAYLIKNGQGNFAGGVKDYGFIGVKLNIGGNYHYCFIELRAQYWIDYIALYSSGYNDVAGGPITTNACVTGISDIHPFDANVFMANNLLHVSLTNQRNEGKNSLQVINAMGDVVHKENLNAGESDIALTYLPGGIYIVVIQNDERMAYRKKVLIP